MNWPPNLARLFSYTRLVEQERDEWKQRAQEWQNYALLSRNMPPVSVEARPQVTRPQPLARPSILGLRRKAAKRWTGQALESLNGERTMEEAADEYAASVKGANGG